MIVTTLSYMSILCLDVGATKVYIGIANTEFEDIIRIPTHKFLKNSDDIIDRFTGKKEINKISVALPGPLDLENKKIYPPNIEEDEIDLVDVFENLDKDINYINDCHAGVIGEYVYGEYNSENMIYLTLSTGIGAGVISDGRLLKGCNDNFAEVGHMFIGGERKCGCGGEGHWEAYCSGKNIVSYAEEITKKSYNNAKQIFQDFRAGKEEALQVIKNFREINSRAFSNLINLYNPELIVLGGSLAINNLEAILGEKQHHIKNNIVNPMPKIKVTSLENYSVLHGLLAISLNKFDY